MNFLNLSLIDALAGRQQKLLLGSPRSFAIVEQLEIQSCAACSDGLEGDDPCNVFAILAFPRDPLIRGQLGDGGVPLLSPASKFCFPLKPLIIEQDNLLDAVHEAREIFKPRPLAVDPVHRRIHFDGFKYALHVPQTTGAMLMPCVAIAAGARRRFKD
jgi:hypothetical protein